MTWFDKIYNYADKKERKIDQYFNFDKEPVGVKETLKQTSGQIMMCILTPFKCVFWLIMAMIFSKDDRWL